MFSAIFGNILGYSQAKVEEPSTNDEASKFSEASTQTSDNKSTSTQVNLDTSKQHNEPHTAPTGSDWVIVDEVTENDKACGCSHDVEMPESKVEADAVNADPLIGSFFQRNEADGEPTKIEVDQSDKTVDKAQTVLEAAKKETWLITPLPCLTSIAGASQQKSMIDNDPLENLLIEQPTRFMSASTTGEAMTTPKRRVKRQQNRVKDEVMQSDDCFIEDLFKEQPATPVMQRSVAEKRKEAEKSSSPVSPTPSNEYPKKISRKSAKNMKKSSSQQKNVNKENMQVKTLLFAECFGKDGQKNMAYARNGQLNRVNKNSALFGLAGNARTRKFHNLQQPSVTTIVKNQKF